jgi:hypothetical protein
LFFTEDGNDSKRIRKQDFESNSSVLGDGSKMRAAPWIQKGTSGGIGVKYKR